MNTFDVLRTAAAPRKPIAEREPAVRHEPRVDDTSAEKRAERARFAKVLAFLASTGESTRAELLNQMPAGDANLLDKLLAEAGAAKDESSADAAASLRYGMLTDSRAASSRGSNADALHGLHNIAHDKRGGNLATLARLAERRSASIEELLALGDNKTADLKSALDALLSRAGTPEFASAGVDETAVVAHAAALAAARSKSASDVAAPVNDADALAPEFRARLDRVIERMKNEFGHDVELVETVRSQERQDHLFEQGRTRGGPVVTWTRDSAHLSGHAADVLVDGKYNNAEGYARLQNIAREEGLRTLGMRDPGHLELPKEARNTLGADVAAQLASRKAVQSLASANNMHGANGVATVASVASVATVASVAQQGVNTPTASPTQTQLHQSIDASTDNGAGTRGERRESDAGEGHRGSDDASASAYGLRTMTGSANPGVATGERVAAPAGAEAFDRAMEAQRVRDNAPARSVSQLTLQVDAPDGGKDEITIGMRGTSVNTHILTDTQNAERLRTRTGELQHALGRHGLEADTVRISGTARQETVDASKALSNNAERDALKVGIAQQSQQGDGSTNQQQRDRTANARDWQERQDARREREEQRQSEGERQRRNPFNPDSK